jgi:pyruvate/2-oxoglutarate dehydrogenase complex dihydrolipoamide acyltransferase (E2) component
MSTTIEVKVPTLDGFKDVPVLELLVAAGDRVQQDQGLARLEAGKDTVEVSSPATGVVKHLKVKVGDRVSEGSALALIEAHAADD